MLMPEAAAMRRVVTGNAELLREAGFGKRRHTFNRAQADGLIHVVSFWMSRKEPPAWTEIPGLRERLYGTFRLDFGVYVPEIRRCGVPKSAWINEYDCQLRTTIGRLMTGDDQVDLLWSLEDEGAHELARAALQDHGIPWLDRFVDKERLLAQFYASGPLAIGMSPAGDLDIAEMLTALGRAEEARRVLERYVQRSMHRGHVEYLAEYLPTIGHAELVDRLRTGPPTPR